MFLRQLEYYSGILFLTTNMVGKIDEAFKSRIHVALQYPRIRLPETMEIWGKLLDRISTDNETADVKVKFKRDELMRFAKDHYKKHEATESTWNGRQIRNAFQTAIALGQYDRLQIADANREDKSTSFIKLRVQNFKNISDTASDFDSYINSLLKPDADRAYEGRFRNDYYDEHTPQGRTHYGRREKHLDGSSSWHSGRTKEPKSTGRGPPGVAKESRRRPRGDVENEEGRATQSHVDDGSSSDEYSDGREEKDHEGSDDSWDD